MCLLSCKYTKLTWTRMGFLFLAWEADTNLSHDAPENWTVTEISLCLRSGICTYKHILWSASSAFWRDVQWRDWIGWASDSAGMRTLCSFVSVFYDENIQLLSLARSCLVSPDWFSQQLAWWSAGDEASSSQSLLVFPGWVFFHKEEVTVAAGLQADQCLDRGERLSLWRFSCRDWINVS